MNPRACPLDDVDRQMGAVACECYAQVYWNDMIVYRGSQLGKEELFNINSVPVDQIEALEYYAGPAQTPLRYSKLNSTCGVVVIHTRRP